MHVAWKFFALTTSQQRTRSQWPASWSD